MGTKGLEERRHWPRLTLAIPVFVKGADERGKEILEFATILNVSAGGVLFTSGKSLRRNSFIFLEIPVGTSGMETTGSAQRKFQARVLRIIHMDGWHWCAARFKSPLK